MITVGIIEIMKFAVQILFGVILFRKWISAENRFYTDIPFLFSITLISVGLGEFVDVLMDFGILAKTLLEYQIRLLILAPGVTAIVFLVAMIWLRDSEKLIIALTSIYGTSYVLIVALSQSIEAMMMLISILLAIMMVAGSVTFLIIWLLKRLPNVNSFLVFLGGIIVMLGQLAEGVFLPQALLWISELIDLVGWSLMFLSIYIPPSYAKTQH
ncbi:MAG: hypothetical protein DRO67_08890 [Candidatus Asgardarchaeum californiense]|nr:MAG: hypothetical protein DRO67_08890 [Candidatus Asgardarchaeum californiense]